MPLQPQTGSYISIQAEVLSINDSSMQFSSLFSLSLEQDITTTNTRKKQFFHI